MDGLDITLRYAPGYGWRPSAYGILGGRTVSYTGEYRATPEQALAYARKALAVYDLLEKVS